MNKFFSFITFSTSVITTLAATAGSVLAHPGHQALEQVHGLIHVEHLLILAAIAGIIFVKLILKKYL